MYLATTLTPIFCLLLYFCNYICMYAAGYLGQVSLEKEILISMGLSWLNKGYNKNNNLD